MRGVVENPCIWPDDRLPIRVAKNALVEKFFVDFTREITLRFEDRSVEWAADASSGSVSSSVFDSARTAASRSRARCIFTPSARSIRPRISDSATGSPFAARKWRLRSSDRRARISPNATPAGVHARTRDRFHRRGQQRLPHPLGQTQPGSTRTLFEQGELGLANFGAD